jgi:hypothetical protein
LLLCRVVREDCFEHEDVTILPCQQCLAAHPKLFFTPEVSPGVLLGLLMDDLVPRSLSPRKKFAVVAKTVAIAAALSCLAVATAACRTLIALLC